MPDIFSCLEALGEEGTDDFGVLVTIHAQPGAGSSEIVGRHGDALKVRVAAPPEAGRANTSICALLAKEVGVPASAVVMVRGETSRQKAVRIDGVSVATVADRLESASMGGRKGPSRRH